MFRTIALILASAAAALAQYGSGLLLGTVTDATGGVVAGARVAVTILVPCRQREQPPPPWLAAHCRMLAGRHSCRPGREWWDVGSGTNLVPLATPGFSKASNCSSRFLWST